jgi:hypothetical protein
MTLQKCNFTTKKGDFMSAKVLFIILAVWLYRLMGVLFYKLRHVRSENEGTRVSIPDPPTVASALARFLLKGRLTWLIYTRYIPSFNKKNRSYWLSMYKEIYLWPWIEARAIVRKYQMRILDHLHIVFRTRGKKFLKESRFLELAKDVNERLSGFKVVEVRPSGNRYDIYLKLPKKVLNFLGPWDENKKDPHQWWPESKYEKEVQERLKVSLRLPNISDNRLQRSKEVVIQVYEGTFCGNPFWGDFQANKWNLWKKDFIEFFSKI